MVLCRSHRECILSSYLAMEVMISLSGMKLGFWGGRSVGPLYLLTYELAYARLAWDIRLTYFSIYLTHTIFISFLALLGCFFLADFSSFALYPRRGSGSIFCRIYASSSLDPSRLRFLSYQITGSSDFEDSLLSARVFR